ncbi:MAG: glycosyltransferase family 4 protein [Lachnospiraceae bacterium]|nr:glycosyltransferase family 4 protein [Lachnospiraceae bacterium]
MSQAPRPLGSLAGGNMPKICFVAPSLGRGGAERVVTTLAEHFHKSAYDLVLVTSRRVEDEYVLSFPLKRRLLEEEIAGTAQILPGVLGRMAKRVKGLKRIFKEEQPDIVVSFLGKMNIYTMLSRSALKPDAKIFLSVRSDPNQEYRGAVDRFLANSLFPKATGVILQTEDARAFFKPAVKAKCTVLPNVLSEEFMEPIAEGERRKEIVMVGRLDANKNHEMVIRAFAKVLPEHPDYKLVIYGDGLPDETNTRPALEKLAKTLKIDEKIVFMGRQSGIHDKIKHSAIFVLASGYEGMPNALLEAMATGLCCISTDCPIGGPRSVIHDHENGVLIPVGDESALEATLLEVMGDETLQRQLGTEAHKLAEELSPERVCRSWAEVLFN